MDTLTHSRLLSHHGGSRNLLRGPPHAVLVPSSSNLERLDASIHQEDFQRWELMLIVTREATLVPVTVSAELRTRKCLDNSF